MLNCCGFGTAFTELRLGATRKKVEILDLSLYFDPNLIIGPSKSVI